MAKPESADSKKRSPRFPPIDDPHEWIWFDFEHSIIIRHLERSVAKSTEFAMPDEFKTENGCIVRRLDTGKIVERPLSVDQFTVGAKLVFDDDFDGRTLIYVACSVTPAKKKPKPKSVQSRLTNSATHGKTEKAKPKPGMLF